ncbi:MAG: nucleoside deaminase, partial [Clostridia bacterium]|nr:nucleoside deaminase [Clostridia bacterium]
MAYEEKFMKKALALAKKAYEQDEVPVGAVIVKDGKVIASAYNKRESSQDATAHAEILAIKKACKKLNDFRLLGAELYVSLEPCVMCTGAILNA